MSEPTQKEVFLALTQSVQYGMVEAEKREELKIKNTSPKSDAADAVWPDVDFAKLTVEKVCISPDIIDNNKKGDFEMKDYGTKLKNEMKDHEKLYILSWLTAHKWNKPKTAKALGIGLSSLYRKIKELGIVRYPL
ncbi:unnamed protein product [marine sediment metagenome]|uniref:DNA binding HTH domain-containing protein n=1 Tax=marine sediment metagenome TaxID=412755 RepID=X1V6M9_9ZZZZ